MRTDILRLSDLSQVDLRAWAELGAAALSPNPFATPDFVLPAARGLGVGDAGLVVVRLRSDWSAAVPVRNLSSWRHIPGRCIAAWAHSYCFLGTPLVLPDRAEDHLAALIDRALRDSSCFALDVIDAGGPLDAPLSAALARRARAVTLEEFERPALIRRPKLDYMDARLSQHHRNEIQRKLRRLEGALGALTLTDRSDDPTAYRDFLELERAGWKGAAGTALACNPSHAEFFLRMCARFAQAGRLQLWSLGSEQRTVAMMCNLVAGRSVFGFKMAFDERLAKFSPGIHLHVAFIQRFHEGGLSYIDSCASQHDETVKRLWPERRRLRSVVAVRSAGSATPNYLKWRAVVAGAPLHARVADRRRRATARRRSRAQIR